MDVYQVVFNQHEKDGKITEIVQYVLADDIKKVVEKMSEFAESVEWDLRGARYALTVTETIK